MPSPDPQSGGGRARLRAVRSGLPHDSAHKHVAGTAMYVDDLPEPANLLHCYIGTSRCVHGHITRMDLDAVRAFPGVRAVISAADIPGPNDISPVQANDEAPARRQAAQG